jgi:MSHA pilin protein MshC
MKKNNGFTMIELIIVILIMGIMSIAVSSRFADRQTFLNRANIDGVKFLIKTAQKAAMSQRREVYVNTNGNIVSICYSNAATCPGGQEFTSEGQTYLVDLGTSSKVIPSFGFNSSGGTTGGSITLTIDGKNLYVEQETGFVHE